MTHSDASPGGSSLNPATSRGQDAPPRFPIRVLDLFSGYTISEAGVITNRFGRVVKQRHDGPGYARVELWSGARGRKYLVHRLLAEAFIPNPLGKPQVNHIDGDKANNALINLEWVTQSENQQHSYRIGLQRAFRKAGCKLSDSHRAALCGSRWFGTSRVYVAGGVEFTSPEDAAAYYNVSRQTVYNRAASPRFPDWEIKTWQEVK